MGFAARVLQDSLCINSFAGGLKNFYLKGVPIFLSMRKILNC